jgi:predicted nucleic acid binding AN1-type Zn finger protein
MAEMIAYCGLLCNECPAYLATVEDDDAARASVAEQWSTEQWPLTPDDICCDGCTSESGRLLSFCADCSTRNCAREHGVANCAYCDDFPCEGLEKHWEMSHPVNARQRLEALHATLGKG